jgi:hypothetical protein
LIESKLDRVLALLDKPKRAVRKSTGYSPEFEEIWAEYPKRAGSNPKNKAYAAFRARLSGDCSVPAMMEGVRRYKRFCEATGKAGTELVMQASRFFGPGYEFENAWDVPCETSAPKTDEEWLVFGKQRGMEPKMGESWYEFKERLRAIK